MPPPTEPTPIAGSSNHPAAEARLPAPEVNVLKTDHAWTFTPGTFGPAMDVLLHNQLLLVRQNQGIIRQNEEINKKLNELLGTKQPGTKQTSAKSNEANNYIDPAPTEELSALLLECSRRYGDKGGELKLKRGKNIQSFVNKWATAIKADEAFSEELREELGTFTAAELIPLHIRCAESIRKSKEKGKGKEKEKEKEKAKKKPSKGKVPINEETDEEEDEDIGEPRNTRPSRRINRKVVTTGETDDEEDAAAGEGQKINTMKRTSREVLSNDDTEADVDEDVADKRRKTV